MDTVWARGALSFHKKSECKDTKNRANNKLKHTTILRLFFCVFAIPFVQTAFKNYVNIFHSEVNKVNSQQSQQMPFSELTFLGVSFLILYIYYNIYII